MPDSHFDKSKDICLKVSGDPNGQRLQQKPLSVVLPTASTSLAAYYEAYALWIETIVLFASLRRTSSRHPAVAIANGLPLGFDVRIFD